MRQAACQLVGDHTGFYYDVEARAKTGDSAYRRPERRSCPSVLVLLCPSRRRRQQSNAAKVNTNGARTAEIGRRRRYLDAYGVRLPYPVTFAAWIFLRRIAATPTWIFRRGVAATPRPRRGDSAETSRDDAAAATRIIRGDESRRRRGRDADSPDESRRRVYSAETGARARYPSSSSATRRRGFWTRATCRSGCACRPGTRERRSS